MSETFMDQNEWHLSQMRWHTHRAVKFGWHRIQARWHARRIAFSWLVARSFRKHQAAALRNITAHNALYSRLTRP